ncbi:hypothetical protein ACHHYP_17360 [Achlya hypogyna]|uniref:CDC20/Fizzy WD40 domain-containing protein n=1 Tax=Achlya hypogyna TaxID=1202772 RepID=A0A1V9Y4P9_ACHHY|nr:hypothetical protein ACHHYP_17360 [Achlya hypogyna]
MSTGDKRWTTSSSLLGWGTFLDGTDLDEVAAACHGPINTKVETRWERRRRRLQAAEVCTRGYRYVALREKPPAAVFTSEAPYPLPPTARKHPCKLATYRRSVSMRSSTLLQLPSEPLDDFYLHVLAARDNTIVCATAQSLHFTSLASSSLNVDTLALKSPISAVAWLSPTHLAVGTSNGNLHTFDVPTSTILHSVRGAHTDRIAVIAPAPEAFGCVSGSRDHSISSWDLRTPQSCLHTRVSHTQEVCGLALSPDGFLIASGSNDNVVCLFDVRQHRVSRVLHGHSAAVKALAWNPHERHVLVTGGGLADKSIKCWHAQTGSLLSSTQAEGQVSALLCPASQRNEIVSAVGYAGSAHALQLWTYPANKLVANLPAPSQGRILDAVLALDQVVTLSADGLLQQYNLLAEERKRRSPPSAESSPVTPHDLQRRRRLLTDYLVNSSMEQLLSLRSSARLLFACLAVNMLLQAFFISYKLVDTVDASTWTSNALMALVVCYTAWIVISAIGGLCGLYSTHYHHTPSAHLCLGSWLLLVFFQMLEGAIAVLYLSPEAELSPETRRMLAVNTIALVLIELVFIAFILGYIQLLEYCAPFDYDTIIDVENVNLLAAQDCSSPKVLVSLQDSAAPSYGTSSYTI